MADQHIPHKETASLIASDKVEGTAVYNDHGERLGNIHNLMLDKQRGQVEYAVLSFGGFLGLGTDYYPLPWRSLTYDQSQGGYVVGIDKDVLKNAPHYAPADEPVYDRGYGETVYRHYGMDYPPPLV